MTDEDKETISLFMNNTCGIPASSAAAVDPLVNCVAKKF